MKKLFLLLLLVGGLSAQSQSFQYGIKAGLGTSYYDFEDLTYINASTLTVLYISPYSSNVGWNIGATGIYSFENLPFSVRLALQYTGSGGQVNILDGFSNSSTTIKEYSSRVDVPLTITWNYKRFRVLGGVGYAFDVDRSESVANHINNRYADSGSIPFVVTSEQNNYMTYHLGLGLMYDKFSVDVVWDNPFDQVMEGTDGVTYNFGPNAKLVTVNFGFYF